jgi:hypothetical protein
VLRRSGLRQAGYLDVCFFDRAGMSIVEPPLLVDPSPFVGHASFRSRFDFVVTAARIGQTGWRASLLGAL